MRATALPTLSAWEESFFSSAQSGNIDCLRSNLERVRNVNIVDDIGETALIKASKIGHQECVKFLLDNEADCAVTSNNGWGAIHYAAYYGCGEVVDLLLNKYHSLANLECKISGHIAANSDKGLRPIHIAAMGDNPEIVRSLIVKGADVSAIAIFHDEEVSALDLAEANQSRSSQEIRDLIGSQINVPTMALEGLRSASKLKSSALER